jgi:NAD(P)-dependent dehydrogenase (short-subunit alcohol dehydrogenase family)
MEPESDLRVDLRNRCALVIGGCGSIGEEIALRLIDNGASVTVASRTEKSISDRLSRAMENEPRLGFLTVDATEEQQVVALERRLTAEHARLDILILAHGIQHRAPIVEFPLEKWTDIIDNNLKSTFLSCKYLTRSMIEQNWGRVIGLTSLTTKIGIEKIGPYAASKGGVNQLLRSAAVEWAKCQVTVNSIAPGRVRTHMTDDLLGDQQVLESNLRRIPMGRLADPGDVSGAVLFLCSKAASYITGQTLVVDGGWLASGGNPAD